MIRAAAIVCLAKAVQGVELKIGGHIQDTYRVGLQPYFQWVETNTEEKSEYTIDHSKLAQYADDEWETKVEEMTTPGGVDLVDVLVCPYTSTLTMKCVKKVNKGFTGPVMVWGGASDTIFGADYCGSLTNKNCFGFFVVGSKYMESGLVALDGKITGDAKVSIIENANAFSKSVANGAETITKTADNGLKFGARKEISVSKKPITTADELLVKTVVEGDPDIIVIAGHNGDVEPVIIKIGELGATLKKRPKAILATNAFTVPANFGNHSNYLKCLLMPTMFDSTTSHKDTVVTWTPAQYATAVGATAATLKYQVAAVGAVGVALANAMNAAQGDKSKLVEKLTAMDTNSFYGKLKWDAEGRIQRSMLTMQMMNDVTHTTKIVAPEGTSDMKFPLNAEGCWGSVAPPATTTTAAQEADGACALGAYHMMLLAAMVAFARM